MDANFIAGQWPLICQGVRSHAAVMGRLLLPETAELLAGQTERFCGQAAPATADELAAHMIDQAAFALRASLVAHADALARLHPGAAGELLAVVREACEPDFPASAEEAMSQSLALTHAAERLSLICRDHVIGRGGAA